MRKEILVDAVIFQPIYITVLNSKKGIIKTTLIDTSGYDNYLSIAQKIIEMAQKNEVNKIKVDTSSMGIAVFDSLIKLVGKDKSIRKGNLGIIKLNKKEEM